MINFPDYFFPIEWNSCIPITNFLKLTNPKLVLCSAISEMSFYVFSLYLFYNYCDKNGLTSEELDWEFQDKPYDQTVKFLYKSYYISKLIYLSIVTFKIHRLVKNSLGHWRGHLWSINNIHKNHSFKTIFSFLYNINFDNIVGYCKHWILSVSPLNWAIALLIKKLLDSFEINSIVFHYLLSILNFTHLSLSNNKIFLAENNSYKSLAIWKWISIRDLFISVYDNDLKISLFCHFLLTLLRKDKVSSPLFRGNNVFEGQLINRLISFKRNQMNGTLMNAWLESYCETFWIVNLLDKFKPDFINLIFKISDYFSYQVKTLKDKIRKTAIMNPMISSNHIEAQIENKEKMLTLQFNSLFTFLLSMPSNHHAVNWLEQYLIFMNRSFLWKKFLGFYYVKSKVPTSLFLDSFNILLNVIYTLSLVISNLCLFKLKLYLNN